MKNQATVTIPFSEYETLMALKKSLGEKPRYIMMRKWHDYEPLNEWYFAISQEQFDEAIEKEKQILLTEIRQLKEVSELSLKAVQKTNEYWHNMVESKWWYKLFA
jgi:hypothetical protein